MEKLIGIDLGTTNCTVSAIDENGVATVIKNQSGDFITPSAVYFEAQENNILVGAKAKEKSRENPNNLVMFVKREMGKTKDKVRYDRIEREYRPYNFWGKTFSPEEISAYILRQLKNDSEKVLGEKITKAVITCPAYFGSLEKEATKTAGEIAGLEVLEVIPEPTAAALCYSAVCKKQNERIFVFDLGGGTFDVTIIELKETPEGRVVDTIATGGDRELGGMDWDKALANYMVEQFAKKCTVDLYYEDGAEKDVAFGKLRLDTERAKKEIVKSKSAKIFLEYGGASIEETITESDYIKITERYMNKCKDCCEEVLKEADFVWGDIDTVLMVGGMSCCTFIQKKLEEWSGKKINFDLLNPKTCVSEGAAIKAFTLMGGSVVSVSLEKLNCENCAENDSEKLEEGADKKIGSTKGGRRKTKIASAKNVLSASIGIKGIKNNKPFVYKMILRNQDYPREITKVFPVAADGMKEIPIPVFEGESENPENCTEIGNAILRVTGRRKKGDQVEVTFSIDNNGILKVKGKDLKSGKEVSAVIQKENALTQKEKNAARENMDDVFFLG